MASRRRITDRRHSPRFEVVGDLHGTLELQQPLTVANIGSGGALIEADSAWPVGSVHSVVVANGTEAGRAQIRVRHVTEALTGSAAFLIGVEFLFLSPPVAAAIARWVEANAGGPAEC